MLDFFTVNERADQALLKAKKSGRDNLVISILNKGVLQRPFSLLIFLKPRQDVFNLPN
ncbi:MAG: hypothetical protein ACI9O6_000092 [Glaciecola sp.]|jgi:hypothetical protein